MAAGEGFGDDAIENVVFGLGDTLIARLDDRGLVHLVVVLRPRRVAAESKAVVDLKPRFRHMAVVGVSEGGGDRIAIGIDDMLGDEPAAIPLRDDSAARAVFLLDVAAIVVLVGAEAAIGAVDAVEMAGAGIKIE